MFHITLSLGILIGGYLISICFILFRAYWIQPNDIANSMQYFQQYSNACYILAIIIAFIVIRLISLKSRLPIKPPGLLALIVGAWLKIILIMLASFPLLTVSLAYIMAYTSTVLPFVLIFDSNYPKEIISTLSSFLIILGLLSVFLATKPSHDLEHNV